MSQIDNSHVSKHLGKTSQYKSTYDPSLLVKEPRQSNRKHLNIDDDKLPFSGVDIWNAYEISCLLDNGMPIAAFAKICYPCDNKYIVESKSLKLYLNSFNMQPMGGTPTEALTRLTRVIEGDLSALLETQVSVTIKIALPATIMPAGSPNEVLNANQEYKTLEQIVDVSKLACSVYTETPQLLQWHQSKTPVVQQFHSALLKSNCRVTSQPDWGDVYIHLVSDKIVDPASLLQYIVSFRDECHFHEEIVETIYKRLHDAFNPVQLVVYGFYVRRGGIDINPIRASNLQLVSTVFSSYGYVGLKTLRQ